MIRNLNCSRDEIKVNQHFESLNPRAFDSRRSIRGCLDKPSLVSGCCSQIQYYVDPATQSPFYEPIYDMKAATCYSPFIDPMDSVKPQFSRKIDIGSKYSTLSFINDTTYHREDIIARQQVVNNQRRSEPFL
jgi:hypothetical protein